MYFLFFSKRDNAVSKLLLWLSILELIFGVIAGFNAGQPKDVVEDFNMASALIWWVAGVFTTAFTLGLSEIIELLQGIRNKA